MDKIKILKVEPGKPPCVKEIANDFKASQEEVEGDIECVGFGDGCVAVINAEGKLNGMQPNRRNGDDIICGPFFICGDTPDGDFISLTEQQIEEYTRRFGEIEQFTGQEPEIIRSVVVFPHPDGPNSVRNSPSAILIFMFFTT